MSDATETSPPSTGELFPSLPSSRAVSPARTSLSLAKGQASQGHGVVSGRTSTEPFLYYDPTTSSWKTYQRSFFEGWDEFSETFPKSGMMRSGKLYQPIVLVLPMNGCEHSSWPTPRASDTFDNRLKRESLVRTYRNRTDVDSPKRGGVRPTEVSQAEFSIVPTEAFHEWLMGYPIGWTDVSEPWATPSSPKSPKKSPG